LLSDNDGNVTLDDDRYFGIQFTTANTESSYLMTGFSCLGTSGSGAHPVGAVPLYVFSSSPHNAVTPATLAGYSTDCVGLSESWDGSEYSFGAGLALDANTTYWVLSDSSGFEAGADFANPNNAIYATSAVNSYVNQLQTINYQVTGTAVPEPGTYTLIFGITMMGVVVYRRRSCREAL